MRSAVVTSNRTSVRRDDLYRRRYPCGHLFGKWWPTPKAAPAKPKKKSPKKAKPAKPATAAKPLPKSIRKGGTRHGHAIDTARGILIGRVEKMLPELMRIVIKLAGNDIPDIDTREMLAIQVIQALQVQLFPEEFAGPAYTPDPAGRLAAPAGLIPKIFTQATAYTAHLKAGRASRAAALEVLDPKAGKTVPLFTDAELARLGERQERRSATVGRARAV